MGKITFYEDKNFKGRSFECSSDNNDLHSHVSRCNSIKVDNGSWMIYEQANNKGHQYFLKKGEYPEYQHWMGFNDTISSCHMIPLCIFPPKFSCVTKEKATSNNPFVDHAMRYSMIYKWVIGSCLCEHTGSFIIKLYEKEDFRGQMVELTEDSPHLYKDFNFRDINSCNVLEGHWIFYEEPNYRGCQYYLKPGEYRRFSEWGASVARIGSIRRVQDFY